MMDKYCTDVVVLGDQRVDGTRVLDKFRFHVGFVVLAGRLAVVVCALEDGDEALGDVFGLLLGQIALVWAWVIAVVRGSNGGGDREGEYGGEDDELHVCLGVWSWVLN